jgi:curved DNA-binding protein CbpA
MEGEVSSTSDAFVFAWLRVLDDLTYYELFAIAQDAGPDDVRRAFHEFCDAFHPDRHVARSDDERAALSTIFKRGTEAYLVLSDSGLRGRYDEQLVAGGAAHPTRISLAHSRPPSRQSLGPQKLEDLARSPAARPFARRAEELTEAGDFQQAKLQLVMANHMDPGNEALEAALRKVEAKLAERKGAGPRP